ncbi:MAG: hypothetical protein HDQ93_05095 [Desulfovibrio sp.]|nr:hypothetical protein [Desulfovibrio sp.]
MEESAELREKLREKTEELLRVKARESRKTREYETELKKLREELETASKNNRKIDAQEAKLAALERENSVLKDEIGDLRGKLSAQAGICPLDNRAIGECAEIAKVRSFIASIEGYQRELLEKSGFSPERPGQFLCRAGSSEGVANLWKEIRQYILERGYAHKAWPFLDAMLEFHSLGGGGLESYSPDIEAPDRDEAKIYWVVPWRENWQYEEKPIDRLLLAGLRDKDGALLVEPLLALKNN